MFFEKSIERKANRRNAATMYAKRQRRVVKGSYLGRFTVCRTHKSLFDPLMMLVTSNKGWKSEKIKLVSATLCHLTAPEATAAGNTNKDTNTDTNTDTYTDTNIDTNRDISSVSKCFCFLSN